MIHDIHHVTIHTADLVRLMQLYRDASGFLPADKIFAWADEPPFDDAIGVPGSAPGPSCRARRNVPGRLGRALAPPAVQRGLTIPARP